MPVRNQGPRGCLLVVGSLVLLGLVLYGVVQLITEAAPEPEVIRSMTTALVKQTVTERPVDSLVVQNIYSRRERYSLSVERWTLEGVVRYRPGAAGPPQEAFIAVVETVCDDYARRDCWALPRLTVGTRTYQN